jgi:tetratricopeptide (TPR) repeat protein
MKARATAAWILALVAVVPVVASAHERIGTVSRALLERPIALTTSAGRMHQEVTTASLEAQAYYDQGIAYLASYAFVDAGRSLHEALRHDPELAMARLQLAKVYANIDAIADTRRELEHATALAAAGRASETETVWIALGVQQRAAVEAPAAEQHAKHYAYKVAIDALIARDPSDPHAWVLRGNAEEPGAWGRGQHGHVASVAFYETALNRDPSHVGAHHFLAHSYENIGRYAEAAAHARIYAGAASGVPHAQHMYGHVLPRLGHWQEALVQLERADQLERASYASEKIAPEEDWHHAHNLHLLGLVHLRLGHDADAARLFEEEYRLDTRGVFGGGSAAPWIEYLLLRGRFEEALAAAQGAEARSATMARLVGAALAGQALLALEREDEAAQALERATDQYETLLETSKGTSVEPFASGYAQPFIKTLAAQVELRGPNDEEAEAQILAIADELARDPRIDAWAAGLFQIQRLADDARRADKDELATALRARLRTIDPTFTPAAGGAR